MKKVKFLLMALVCASMLNSAELPTRKVLNMAALKSMAAAAEAEALKRNVHITLAIVDESLNLLYLEHGDDAAVNTILLAQKKARHAAAFHSPFAVGGRKCQDRKFEWPGYARLFPDSGWLAN